MDIDVASHLNNMQEKGYTVLKKAISRDQVALLLDRVREVAAKKERQYPDYPTRNYGYYYNLQNDDVIFIKTLFSNPQLQELLIGVLNDPWYATIDQDKPNYIFRGIKARNGGKKALPLHIDSFIPSSAKDTWVAIASVILEDQTPENGCTMVVPGSHRYDSYASQEAKKDAVPIISKAGDIVVWDGRLWHGTYENQSDRSRWVLISGFCRWWVKQSFQATKTLPDAIYQQLTDAEKTIMGYCSLLPKNEYDPRSNIKCGYDMLPEHAPSLERELEEAL